MSGWHTVISVAAAVVGGLCLAGTGVLQQRAASKRPSQDRFSLRLVKMLARDRTWVAGIALAGISYGFQALALSFGPLALVQPLLISELVFAVPISMRRFDLRMGKREWAAVLMVVGGLAVGIVSADPRQGEPVQPITAWAPALGAIALITAAALLVNRRVRGPAKASVFAFAGACLMGLQSGLYDATITILGAQRFGVFAHWEAYALIVVSLAGGYLVQVAFQSGPLAASSPVMDATLPLVAIGLGLGLFGEAIRTSTLGLAGGCLGLFVAVAGIALLDTSPLVRHEQHLEHEMQEQ